MSGDSPVGERDRRYEGIGSSPRGESPPHTAGTGSTGGGTVSASRGPVEGYLATEYKGQTPEGEVTIIG